MPSCFHIYSFFYTNKLVFHFLIQNLMHYTHTLLFYSSSLLEVKNFVHGKLIVFKTRDGVKWVSTVDDTFNSLLHLNQSPIINLQMPRRVEWLLQNLRLLHIHFRIWYLIMVKNELVRLGYRTVTAKWYFMKNNHKFLHEGYADEKRPVIDQRRRRIGIRQRSGCLTRGNNPLLPLFPHWFFSLPFSHSLLFNSMLHGMPSISHSFIIKSFYSILKFTQTKH